MKFLYTLLLFYFSLVFLQRIDCQDFWVRTNGPSGGMITDIKINSVNHIYTIVYGGSALFRSTDNGENWDEIDVLNDDDDFTAIHIDDTDKLFVCNSTKFCYSDNNGDTWELKNISFPIITLTSDAENLFAGGPEGIYLSTDNGNTWTEKNNGLNEFSIWVNCIITDDNDLYIGTAAGIYKSTDIGNSWTEIPHSKSQKVSCININSLGHIYAGVANLGLLKSTDEGVTWVTSKVCDSDIISISFNSEDHIFVGSNEEGVFYSTDNGEQWNSRSEGLQYNAHFRTYHVNSIVLNSTDHIFIGTYSGIFRSTDNGELWIEKSNSLTGSFVNTLFTCEYGIFAGCFSDGAFRSIDKGKTWKKLKQDVFSPDYPDVQPDVFDFEMDKNNKLYAATNHGLLVSTDNGDSWAVKRSNGYFCIGVNSKNHLILGSAEVELSTNSGETWLGIYRDDNIWRINCIGIDSQDNIFLGTVNGLVKSTDNGLTWKEIISQNEILSIAFNTLGHIFAGTYYNGLYISSDQGENWVKAFKDSLKRVSVTSILIDNFERIYCGTQSNSLSPIETKGVFTSSDNGNTWVSINHDLKSTNITSLAIDKDGFIYAGTSGGGVFKSFNPVTLIEKDIETTKTIFSLEQNYPNPFNPSTTINYSIPEFSMVTLKIFDILGREISTLVNEEKSPGNYNAYFSSDNLSSGIYFYRIKAKNYTQTKKMLLLQ